MSVDLDRPVSPALLDITQAAEVLNVPRTWLRDKVTARAVPHTRLGRHVRFSAAHIAQIVAEGDQAPLSRPAGPSAGSRGPQRRSTARTRL